MARRRLRLRQTLAEVRRGVICATPDLAPGVCRGLGYFWLDGLFIALSFSFYGSFQSLFLLGFGASNSQIGLMSGLSSFAGIVAYLMATRATNALGGRKRAVIFSRISGRVILLLIALVPFVASGLVAVYLTIALICVQVVCESVGTPAWTALVADIVPLRIRARYIASRNIAKSAARTVAVALAGQFIRALGFPTGYQAAFVAAAAVGLMAAYAYSRIPVDRPLTARPQPQEAADPLSFGRDLRLYMVARAIWAFGYHLAAPFYAVYLVKNLGGNESTVGLLASVGSITAVVGLLVFSRAVERHGLRRMWLLSSALQAGIPWLWAVAPAAWFGFLPAAADGLLLAGLELVNLNTLLVLTSESRRTQFIAVNSAVLSSAMMLGPLAGGALSDAIGFAPVFALGGIVSLVGCALYYLFVPEPGQAPAPLAVEPAGGRLPGHD